MKQVEHTIMGQVYTLACPDGTEERLRQAVARVDEAMCQIRDAGKLRARERIAVLAALNLAFDLQSQESQGVAAAPQPAAATTQSIDSPRLQALLQQVDQVLQAPQGQLL